MRPSYINVTADRQTSYDDITMHHAIAFLARITRNLS